MLNIGICDMKKTSREKIVGFCEMFFYDKYVDYIVKEYTSGESLLVEDFPDILFLDVELERIDGLLIKEIFYKLRVDTKLIYVSDSSDKMQLAFGKNVYGYLEKQVSYNEFWFYMERAVNDILDEKEVVYCKNNHRVERIYLREISYIKAYGRYTQLFLHRKNEYRLCDFSFREWYLEMENKSFARCHRSYLVNLFYIKRISKEIELLNEIKIPLSREMRAEFKQNYEGYMRSGI